MYNGVDGTPYSAGDLQASHANLSIDTARRAERLGNPGADACCVYVKANVHVCAAREAEVRVARPSAQSARRCEMRPQAVPLVSVIVSN